MDTNSADQQPGVVSRATQAQRPPVLERLGIPKGVALALGAGLVGVFVGGAIAGFTAAAVAPAVRERLRRRSAAKKAEADKIPS